MKTKNILSVLAVSALVFTGCVDLDTIPEGNIVTSDQKDEILESDPSKAEASVNAIYTQFSLFATVITETERHNDIGYPALMLFMDTNGADFLSDDNGYNWMGNSLTFDDRIFTSYESRINWGVLYNQIYAANTVISFLGEDSENTDYQNYVAQAHAARAFDYWVLAQLYQFNYTNHKSDPCVPIITEKNALTVTDEGCPRATVEQVYAQMMEDINKAISVLEDSPLKRRDKRYISVDVAYGIRARINLSMGNWAAAAEDADKAISLSSSSPYTIEQMKRPAFNSADDNSWMWGIKIAETDEVVTTGICNFPSHMGSFNYGYCWYSGGRQINKMLFESIPATDVRRGWWLDENTQSPNLNEEDMEVINTYYGPYTQVKYAPYKGELWTSTNASDIPLMRIEEMYLIKAEGQAMSGNVAGAKTTLESFIQEYRDPEFTCKATSPQDMQEEIYHQRRIELWGEGMSWFDIMRLNKGVDRRGAGYPNASSIFNIQPGDPILLWRLPEKEIQANKALSNNDNNKATPIPSPVPDFGE